MRTSAASRSVFVWKVVRLQRDSISWLDERDRSREPSRYRVDRRERVETHLEVGQEHSRHTGGGGERAHQMTVEMLRAGRDWTGAKRHLAQEDVAGPEERTEIVGPTAVARIDEAAPARPIEDDTKRVALISVRDATGLDREGPLMERPR